MWPVFFSESTQVFPKILPPNWQKIQRNVCPELQLRKAFRILNKICCTCLHVQPNVVCVFFLNFRFSRIIAPKVIANIEKRVWDYNLLMIWKFKIKIVAHFYLRREMCRPFFNSISGVIVPELIKSHKNDCLETYEKMHGFIIRDC